VVQQVQQQGFILTRHWRDTAAGTEVEFWLATADGPQHVRLPLQPSVAFIPAEQSERVIAVLCNVQRGDRGFELRPLPLLDFHQRPVVGLYVQHHRQLLKYEKLLKENGIDVYEADIRPPERYLMERFITASLQFSGEPNGSRSWLNGHLKAGAITGRDCGWHRSISKPRRMASCIPSRWRAAVSARCTWLGRRMAMLPISTLRWNIATPVP